MQLIIKEAICILFEKTKINLSKMSCSNTAGIFESVSLLNKPFFLNSI